MGKIDPSSVNYVTIFVRVFTNQGLGDQPTRFRVSDYPKSHHRENVARLQQ